MYESIFFSLLFFYAYFLCFVFIRASLYQDEANIGSDLVLISSTFTTYRDFE